VTRARVCDGRCHDATTSRCRCWCAGLFHGAASSAARQAFRAVWGAAVPPAGRPEPDLFGDLADARAAVRWTEAMRVAQLARAAAVLRELSPVGRAAVRRGFLAVLGAP